MADNPLLNVHEFGQSIWLDFLRRGYISSGALTKLIDEDGLRGVTSNPKIFEKAIAGSHDYDDAIETLALEGETVEEIYQALTVEDVQRAADLFRPTYDETEGRDGFVSLEVNPHLAHDTDGTIAEARRLWSAVHRPNVMIKVPATIEGLPAIEQLISEGINVNVTLLFGLPRYRKVAEAYIAGLEKRAARGEALDNVASVASFFLSRIDVLVDPMLDRRMADDGREATVAAQIHGQVAVASAKIAYEMYNDMFDDARFRRLAGNGARTQRLLWASTSTKNPQYSDVKYVEALIGPETVNTVPLETLNAFRDHGEPAERLTENVEEAHLVMQRLAELDIDIDNVTQQLEDEGVEKFNQPFDRLMDTLQEQRKAALEEPVDRQTFALGEHRAAVDNRLDILDEEEFVARLWRKDAGLWSTDPEDRENIRNGLGWLHVAEKMEDNLRELDEVVAEVKSAGFRRVVHIGMGGSSLAPLVFQRTFEAGEHGLPLQVLDTTDPATILAVENEMDIDATLFIVASKSGTTAETRALGDYFYKKLYRRKRAAAGENFVAITDPGSPLADLADERGFRRTFLNFADIGGRYSALSYFGLVPAALYGIDVGEVLARALRMLHACDSCVPVGDNPGVTLGAVLGELALDGRDKLTLLMPESLAPLGMWLEQLLAESTGKDNTGILPVAGEPLGNPSVYGDDRLFIYIRFRSETDADLERGVKALQDAGHPVVTIQMDDRLDLGQEFFRWEIATATAGAILDINAFNQPNVQESKDNTNRLLNTVETTGQLPDEEPAVVDDPLTLYAQERAHAMRQALTRFLGEAHEGDYVALMAYLPDEEPATQQALQDIRVTLRDSLHVATTLGYGPRFLHSTGQFHKGGSNVGVFLQLTANDSEDASVPDESYPFSVFKRAQALGDLQVLRRHSRRVVRIHLGDDVEAGLSALADAIQAALAETKRAHVAVPTG